MITKIQVNGCGNEVVPWRENYLEAMSKIEKLEADLALEKSQRATEVGAWVHEFDKMRDIAEARTQERDEWKAESECTLELLNQAMPEVIRQGRQIETLTQERDARRCCWSCGHFEFDNQCYCTDPEQCAEGLDCPTVYPYDTCENWKPRVK